MRAIWLREFGDPEVLVPGEAADPEANADQVVVEMAAVGVPFVETQVRSGNAPIPLPTLPIILGNAVGGTVVSVGRRADPALVGRRVVTSLGGSGGYAEQAVADAAGLIPIPRELSLNDAVALLADGRTAMGIHRSAAPHPGEWVLVESAAGGVGSLLVQLALAAGAQVIAAASSQRKLDLAGEVGAQVTVNYTEPGWDEYVRQMIGGAGVQVAFDGVGGEIGRASFGLVAPGGRFLMYGAASGSVTQVASAEFFRCGVDLITGRRLFSSPSALRNLASDALAEAAAGRLSPVIGQTYPLTRAAEAHAAVEARVTLGKTLLIP